MSRYTGCLLGLAAGDALGAPLEGMKEGHIRQIFGEVTGFADPIAAFPDRPGKWRLRGLYTDDTQQALALADVLAVHGEADTEALADLYIRLLREGPSQYAFGAHRGTGHFFRRAVLAMEEIPDDPLACGQPSAGNGAAMRVAPIGLHYAHDDEALGKAAVEVSLMTHHDPRGVAAALAVALAVARFARLGAEDGDPALEIAGELPHWVAEWEERLEGEYRSYLLGEALGERTHQFSKGLQVLAFLVREGDDLLAAKTILRHANNCDPATPVGHPHAGFALASVTMALYRALSARDFRSGLLATVRQGGDADTAGAMAGAVLGARFGERAIPEEWLASLLNVRQIRLRGQALETGEVDWSVWEDYVETEKALTESEASAVLKARGDNRKPIEKRERRQAERRERAAKKAAKAPPTDPDGATAFAPPPEVWLREVPGNALPDPLDPIQAKKDRARRGRKRVAWKEERRGKQKQLKKD